MTDDVVIRVDGLWKRYCLPLAPVPRRYWRSLHNGRRLLATGNPDDDGPWALRDINLEVRRGETLGIIGRTYLWVKEQVRRSQRSKV